MKRIAIVSVFLVFSQTSYAESICFETSYGGSYKSSFPTVDSEEIIRTSMPLFQGGKIKCDVSLDFKLLNVNIKTRVEEGFLEGVKYRVYLSDGSGSIQGLSTNTLDYTKDKYDANWSTQCQIDEMDDTHWCSLGREDLRIGIWKDGTPFVSVGSSHYPDSNIAVRIDKNKPITALEKNGFTNTQSLEIIRQLKEGKLVLTRYQEWPYQSNKDRSMDVFGFPQAWKILQKVYESIGERK